MTAKKSMRRDSWGNLVDRGGGGVLRGGRSHPGGHELTGWCRPGQVPLKLHLEFLFG